MSEAPAAAKDGRSKRQTAYASRCDRDSRVTMGFDCLFRGLEITTGSRRINEYKMLLDNVEMFGLKPEGLADYLSIFKYGCPPHGGFAIGLERLTQKVLGLANVKEACLFPRDRRRVRP